MDRHVFSKRGLSIVETWISNQFLEFEGFFFPPSPPQELFLPRGILNARARPIILFLFSFQLTSLDVISLKVLSIELQTCRRTFTVDFTIFLGFRVNSLLFLSAFNHLGHQIITNYPLFETKEREENVYLLLNSLISQSLVVPRKTTSNSVLDWPFQPPKSFVWLSLTF